jgi:hypothetical protein
MHIGDDLQPSAGTNGPRASPEFDACDSAPWDARGATGTRTQIAMLRARAFFCSGCIVTCRSEEVRAFLRSEEVDEIRWRPHCVLYYNQIIVLALEAGCKNFAEPVRSSSGCNGKLIIFCFFLFQNRLNKQPRWLIKQQLFEEVHSCFRQTLCASLICTRCRGLGRAKLRSGHECRICL